MNGPHGKVLHVNDYPADGGGGTEVIMARTAELQRAAGLQVETFTARDLEPCKLSALRYIHNRVSQQRLSRRLEAFRPDVVHLHNFYHVLSPSILCTLKDYKGRCGARVVMTAHDSHLICPNSGGTWCTVRAQRRQRIDARRLGRWSYLLSRKWDHRGLGYSLLKLLQHFWHYRLRDHRDVLDAIIAPSRFLQQLFAAAGQPSVHLPHPAPAPLTPRERPRDPLRLIFVGRVEPEKGVAEFLQVLPSTFRGTFTIVGAGSDLKRCQEICRHRQLQERVRFLGWQPHAAVFDLIAAAHVLVLPSLFLESYGLCLVEALTVGTNLLVSHWGAAHELVEASGVGYVFRPRCAESLALQLERIAQSHREGTLNLFDVSTFLEQRKESAYLRGLLDVYQGRLAG